MADENCTNDDNGTRFDFLWFGMEGNVIEGTCNTFFLHFCLHLVQSCSWDFDACTNIYICTHIKICSKIMFGEGLSELTHRY